MLKSIEVIYQHFLSFPPHTRGLSCLNCTKHPDFSQIKPSAVWAELLTRVNYVYLCQRCVCACVCALYVHLYIRFVPFEVSVLRVRVYLCECVGVRFCGCTPQTLKGSRQSESTMNPGIPPQQDSERSPVNGGRVGG